MKPPSVPPESAHIIRLGKDEMNLAEFPITLLSDRVPRGKQVIEYQDQVFDEKNGRSVTRRLTISADQADGLPTAVDDDVLLALIQMTKRANNFTSREVDFSRLELIRMLGWPDSGASYKRLTTSLKRWLGVKLVYENAWWDNRQQSWKTKGFHVIDNFEVNDARISGEQGELFASKVLWNATVFDSFQAGYLKSIDYTLYRGLNHPTSKRMYHRADLIFDLRDLAFEHVGLSRSYAKNAAKIKEKLQPALKELEEVGFLSPMGDDARFAKEGKNWKIRLVQAGRAPAAEPREDAPDQAVPPGLARELVDRGVTEATALELAAGHPEEALRSKLDVFDWLVEARDRRVSKNPAGYLVNSIRQGYAPPAGFVPREERDRLAATRREAEHRDPEARQRERDAADRDRREIELIDAYWNALGPVEQADLLDAARLEADPAARDLASGPARRLGESLLRRSYIRRLLILEGKIADDPAPVGLI